MARRNKCVYFNCFRSKVEEPSLTLFHFPKNDPIRAQEWVKKSGNIDLTILTHEELSAKYVCAHHFSKCDIRH
ncbi:unnamed protein product [Macrosiphum euphorbiae]|uniref:THAP-type domain-containing protein n=1 Tax=Macrosiphum euphorbiae TaxID=13131 RepID=A0AAV0WEA7_9HEMI|nr:unnamed protein product [Macrosiphum euphorbiae]